MKSIPLYKPYIPFALKHSIALPLKTGWLGYGRYAKQIENMFTNKFGGFAISTNSCTSALYVAARLIYSTPNDEVIVPAITFVSTAMAFKTAGLRVVIADVNESGILDVSLIHKYITKKTKAIVIVDLYGQKAEINKLKNICIEKNITLIEDCAHRIGFYDAEKIADICCFSFNVTKELPSGEGGLIWCKNTSLENKARSIANVGLCEDTIKRTSSLMHRNYFFSNTHGLKLLQNDLVAFYTINLFKSRYKKNISARKQIFNKYDKALLKINHITLLSRSEQDSFLMYVIKIPAEIRNDFREYLANNNISTSMHYPNLADHPLFSTIELCTNAKKFSNEIVTLPCYPALTKRNQEYIIKKIEDYFNNEN